MESPDFNLPTNKCKLSEICSIKSHERSWNATTKFRNSFRGREKSSNLDGEVGRTGVGLVFRSKYGHHRKTAF